MDWKYRHSVLTLTTLAFIVTMIARLAISALVPLITTDLGVSTGLIGGVLSGMWAAYALTQYPSGVFGDRFGERRIILTAVGLTVLASAALVVVSGFMLFAVLVIVLGGGAGLHYTVGTTYLSKQFDNVGRAVGIHVAGGPIAGLFTPPLAAAIGTRYGWKAALLMPVVIGVLTFVLFAWRTRTTEPAKPDMSVRSQFSFGEVRNLVRRPSIAFMTALTVIGAFAWQGTASFLPAYLTFEGGLSTTVAGGLFSLFFLVNGITQPLTGSLSERLQRDTVAILTMIAGVVGYTGLIMANSIVWYGVAVVVIGFAMSWSAPLQSRFLDYLPESEQNTSFGIFRTIYMGLGATGSVVVGVIVDVADWNIAFGVLGGVMFVGFVLLLWNRLWDVGL